MPNLAKTLAAVALCANPALADDGAALLFDNAAQPNPSATETLFVGWQISYQLYQDAIDAGAPATEIAALAAASDAAGAAYEASLVAVNTVMLSSDAMEPLSDEIITEIFAE